MKIHNLLHLFEQITDKDHRGLASGTLDIRKVQEAPYANQTMDFIDRFLSEYPEFGDKKVDELIHYLYEIRPGHPLPKQDPGRSKVRARGAEGSFANALHTFLASEIRTYVTGGSEVDTIPSSYGQVISRYRQFLENVKGMRLEDFAGGLPDMVNRFKKTRDVYNNHKQALLKMTFTELIHVPILLSSSEKRGGTLYIDMDAFKSKVMKTGGSSETVDSVITTLNDLGIIGEGGTIAKEDFEKFRKAAAEINDGLKDITSQSSRLDTSPHIASQRSNYYVKAVEAAKKLIPTDLIQRVVPIVNNEIAGKGFTKIHERYDDPGFRDSLAGALYTALVIQQSSYHLRAALNAIKNMQRVPPVNKWKERKDRLANFEPERVKKLLHSTPNHPMVKVFRKIRLS